MSQPSPQGPAGRRQPWRLGRSLKPFGRPWLWASVWCLAIAAVVAGSLLPASDIPEMPRGGDKLEHFFGYAFLAAFAVQLYARRAAWVGAAIGLVLLGIGLEYAQGALTTTRLADPADALANTLGVLAGLATMLTPWARCAAALRSAQVEAFQRITAERSLVGAASVSAAPVSAAPAAPCRAPTSSAACRR